MFDANEIEETSRTPSPRGFSPMASHSKNQANQVSIKRHQRGFSLLECVIVMLILAVGLLAIGGLMGTAIKASATSKELTTAATLLQEKCESLNRVPFDMIVSGTDTTVRDGVSYRRQWAITRVGDTKAIGITVTVNGRQVYGDLLRGR